MDHKFMSNSATVVAARTIDTRVDSLEEWTTFDMQKQIAKAASRSPWASTQADASRTALRRPRGAGCQSPRLPIGTPLARNNPMQSGLEHKI